MSLILLSKTVSVAGTRETLASATIYCKQLFVQALSTNTGKIYIGDNTVIATVAIELGTPVPGVVLPAVRLVSVDESTPINISDLYIDAEVSGEGVNIYYEPY